LKVWVQTKTIGLLWGAWQGTAFIVAGFSGILFPDWHVGQFCTFNDRTLICVDRLNFYGYHFEPGAILLVCGILGFSALVAYSSTIRTAIGAVLLAQILALLFASAVLSIPQSPLSNLPFPIVAISYSLLFFEIFFLGILGSLAGLLLRAGISGFRERRLRASVNDIEIETLDTRTIGHLRLLDTA
jgi:hypothetical protein